MISEELLTSSPETTTPVLSSFDVDVEGVTVEETTLEGIRLEATGSEELASEPQATQQA